MLLKRTLVEELSFASSSPKYFLTSPHFKVLLRPTPLAFTFFHAELFLVLFPNDVKLDGLLFSTFPQVFFLLNFRHIQQTRLLIFLIYSIDCSELCLTVGTQ